MYNLQKAKDKIGEITAMYKLKQTNTQKNKKEIHCISEIKFNIQPHMAINSSGHNDNN